jgi:hypothetical protein
VIREEFGKRKKGGFFFAVELVEEAVLAHIKRAAGFALCIVAMVAIVETPAGGAAFYGCAGVCNEIIRVGVPAFSKSSSERFLIVQRDEPAKLFAPRQILL